MVSLGRVIERGGRLADAERQYAEALAITRAATPEGSPTTAGATLALGHVMVRQQKAADAEPLLRETLAFRRGSLPAGHRAIGEAEAALGDCLVQQSKLAEAEPLLSSALKSAPSEPTALLYRRQSVLALLVSLHERAGRPEAARSYRAELQSK
jgi:serine/threonine-protein kinase